MAASPLYTEKVPLGYSKEKDFFDIFKDLPKVFMKVRFLKDFENLLKFPNEKAYCKLRRLMPRGRGRGGARWRLRLCS